ncbi:MAG: hypothetical protein WAW11_02545 [Patescibacteria group bacterium]
MEKLIINNWGLILLSVLSLAMFCLIVVLLKQKRKMEINFLENEAIIKLFQALAGNNQLTPELIAQIPIAYIAAFRKNIKSYYESLIEEASFTQLANFIYELENSISDFHKKRLLMELFSTAANRISSLHWAKLLMESVLLSIMLDEPDYQQKAKRLEEFIIANAKSNKSLLLLAGDFSDELVKDTKELSSSELKKAEKILDSITGLNN